MSKRFPIKEFLKAKASSGYGMLFITVTLAMMMFVILLLQMVVNQPSGLAIQRGLRNNTLAQATASSAFVRVRDKIQTDLNNGTAVNVNWSWANSVSTPTDPNNLAGSTSVTGTFTATVTKKSGNFYLVSVTATSNGSQYTETRLMQVAATTQYLLDKVPGAYVAYGLRKLRSAYSGYAVKVSPVNSDGTITATTADDVDIGFESDGDLDEATLKTTIGLNTAPPLDTVTTAAGAFSLRKLRTAYAGSAIQVRRSSDNALQDIGFDANGNLDTAALTTFVGAGDGYVKIWYDQSGNGRDMSSINNATQPMIVENGLPGSTKVIMENNRPALYFDGQSYTGVYPTLRHNASSTIMATRWSSYIVGKLPAGGPNYPVIFSVQYASDPDTWHSNRSAEIFDRDNFSDVDYMCSLSANPVWADSLNWASPIQYTDRNNTNAAIQATTNFTATQQQISLNGGNTNSRNQTIDFRIDRFAVSNEPYTQTAPEALKGKISEIIFYANNSTADHDAATRATIKKNQFYYYGIYSAPMGRIVKWYDQSGNGKDLTPVNSSNPPLIVLTPKPAIAFQDHIAYGSIDEHLANTAISIGGTQLSAFVVAMLSEQMIPEGRLLSMHANGAADDYNGAAGFMYAVESDGGFQPNNWTRYMHPARNGTDQTTAQFTVGTNFQTSLIFNGSTANGRIDGVNGTVYGAGGASTGTFNIQQIHVGKSIFNSSEAWTGTISEVIIYNSNPTTATVEADQKAYFGTP